MDGIWKQKMVMLAEQEKLIELTREELSGFNGKDGRPAYVAVKNIVYDVSGFPTWATGIHFDIVAGTDATPEFEQCHSHVILEKLQAVGRLVP